MSLFSPNSGVNLRDEKCQRIMTLPDGTYSENFPPGQKVSLPNGGYGEIKYSLVDIVCKAGGEFYMMVPFVYKGQIYQVAEILTKFE